MEAASVGNKSQIKAIFFDFGKTIHDFHLDFFFNWLQSTFGIPRHHFWNVFSGPDGLIMKYEVGMSTKLFLKEFRKRTEAMLQELREKEGKHISYPEYSDKEFIDAWNSVIDHAPPMRERLDLMRKLKGRGYKIYILSNTNKAHVAYFKGDAKHGYRYTRFKEIFQIADRFIASSDSDIRSRKTRPNGNNTRACQKIFKKALAVAGVEASEAVFVDDIADFVNVFHSMGGHGILCTGNWTKVEAELYALGVRWE